MVLVPAVAVALLAVPPSAAQSAAAASRAIAGLTFVAFALAAGPLATFYDWFHGSGLKLASRRGMGSRGHPVYGVVPMPALSPAAFRAVYSVFLAALFAAAAGGPRSMFAVAYACSLLVLSQLFAETTAGQHSSLVVPAVLLYFAACPPAVAVWCTRAHLASLYFGGALSKLAGSVVGGNVWVSGHTLRACVFHALWSRPGPSRTHWITRTQAALATAPQWLLAVAAMGAVAFEVAAPVAAVPGVPLTARVAVAAAAWSFHAGVFVVVGIDFVCHWTPALLVFVVAVPAPVPSLAAVGPLLAADPWVAVAAVHLALQVLFVLTLNEARGGTGPLPFSCSPMFAMPQRLDADDMVNWFTDTDANLRCPGHLGTTEWSGPVFASHTLDDNELRLLPWRVTYVGSTACRFPRVAACVWEQYQSRSRLLFSNLQPADAPLLDALREFAESSPLCGERAGTPGTTHLVRDAVESRLACLDSRVGAAVGESL